MLPRDANHTAYLLIAWGTLACAIGILGLIWTVVAGPYAEPFHPIWLFAAGALVGLPLSLAGMIVGFQSERPPEAAPMKPADRENRVPATAGRSHDSNSTRLLFRHQRFEMDNKGARRVRGNIVVEEIDWDELSEVRVLTTDDGPWADDFFFVLLADGGDRGCVIPAGAVDASSRGEGPGIMGWILALPGFNFDAFTRATGSADNAQFLCWRKPLNASSSISETIRRAVGAPAGSKFSWDGERWVQLAP